MEKSVNLRWQIRWDGSCMHSGFLKKYSRINGIVSARAGFLPQSTGLMETARGRLKSLRRSLVRAQSVLQIADLFQETFRPCPLLPQR
jgi:hypothetical protein